VSLCPISLFNILHQMSFYDILSLIRLHLNSDKHVLLTSKIPYAFYNFTSKFTYYVHKTLMHLSCHHMRSHFNFQHYKGMIKTPPFQPPIVVCVGNKSPWKRRLWWFGEFTQLQIGEFLTPRESRGDNGSFCINAKWCLNFILQPLHVIKT
jgi:hypothetical protein